VKELVEEFVRNAEAAGYNVHREAFEPPPDAGVSRAAYGLASTGSVVILASPDEPRAASVLPEVHVAILHEDTILAGLTELFAAIGGDLPSAVAVVTGPSASADIGQRHLVGVHGPREVHIVLERAKS
jgi:L-lactate dehydrogenase complex protein LldG